MRAVVVGAGVLGASAAYHLARAGCAVTLVDRADEGRATAAGAGIVCPWGSPTEDGPSYALLAGGARYYHRLMAMLAEDGEEDLGYARVGGLYVPGAAGELEAVERRARARMAAAPEAGSLERVAPAAARTLFPPLRPDQPALFVSGGARVDGRRLAAALQRAAVRHGCRSLTGSAELMSRSGRVDGRRLAAALQRAAVRHGCRSLTGSAELMSRSGRVAGVRIDGSAVEADVVIVAAGAWANQVLEPVGVRLAVAPQRGQIIHLRLPGTDTARWPVLMPLDSYYLLAFDDSRVVVGASRETGSGFDYRVTAAGVAEVLNAGLAVAPGLAGWTLHEIRVGFRPLAADGRPMLGAVPGLDGLLIGNGLGPSGLTMGPYAGALLADAALGRSTELELAAYAPARRA